MTTDLLGPDHETGRLLMRTAVRLLARGTPVTMAELATAAGVDDADLRNAPAAQDIEYDDELRIVGWGLTLNPTPHTFIVDGHRLYTWCAADTLMFPAIIGGLARVESRCPTTDTAIRLTVDPQDGVTDLSPGTAVISIPDPKELDDARVRASCCNPGRFFASVEAAADWLAQYPSGTMLPSPTPIRNCSRSVAGYSTEPSAWPGKSSPGPQSRPSSWSCYDADSHTAIFAPARSAQA